jgi:alkylation response protein AidB-like acyl-CoA dehydrogenase
MPEVGDPHELWRSVAAEPPPANRYERFRGYGTRLVPLPLVDLTIVAPLLGRDAGFPVLARPEGDATVSGGRLTASCPLVPFGDVATEFIVPLAGAVYVVTDGAVQTQSAYDVCSRPSSVTFAGVDAELVLDGDEAAAWWREVTAESRLAVASETSGVLAAVCDQAVEYARGREQFGRPVGSFQAVQHMLAGMVSRQHTLASLCEYAAAAGPGELPALATAAKAYAAEVALGVVERALQVHGATGYTQERPLHHYMKRTMTLAGAWGERRDVLREIGRSRIAAAS